MARNKFDIDETLESPFNINHLKRSWKYVKVHKWRMILALLINCLSSIVSLITPQLSKQALDVAMPEKDIKYLVLLSIAFAGCIAVSIVLSIWRQKIMAIIGQAIIHDIRIDLFEHLQRLSFNYYDSRPHGKILTRVVQYVNNVSNILSNGILTFVLDLFNIIMITVFMFITNVELSWVTLIGMPVFIAIIFILSPIQRRAWQRISNKSSNLNAYLAESVNGVRVTQAYAREKVNSGIFRRLAEEYRKMWMKAIYASNATWYACENIMTLITAAIYLAGMVWIGPEIITVGVLTTMTNYSWRFWQPISSLAQLYNNVINSMAYLERIFETIDEPVDIKDADDAYELPSIVGKVEFKDVTFGYEEGKNVLENLSFVVEPGESVALVGPTGAGKTTIVNLLSRFYDTNKGSVLIDGNDVSKVTLKSLRSQMGIMLQDSFVFAGTVDYNLKYGKLDATREEMDKACAIVKADSFISELENGYDTELNENGSRLSQGQKQLLSFARTLISDPKILILDEATSSIDTKTEALLQQGLLNMLKGRTSFIIAHRLSTIKSCDKIMYVSNKGITECGTHDELMEKKGDYYNLYMSQVI